MAVLDEHGICQHLHRLYYYYDLIKLSINNSLIDYSNEPTYYI